MGGGGWEMRKGPISFRVNTLGVYLITTERMLPVLTTGSWCLLEVMSYANNCVTFPRGVRRVETKPINT